MNVTKLLPDSPRIVDLCLPQDRIWYSFGASVGVDFGVSRGGDDAGFVGMTWPEGLHWSGIGTPVKGLVKGSVLLLSVGNREQFFHFWIQRLGFPGKDVFLEARWNDLEERNAIDLKGLESNPSDTLVKSVLSVRNAFLPDRAGGRPDNTKNYTEERYRSKVERIRREDEALYQTRNRMEWAAILGISLDTLRRYDKDWPGALPPKLRM